MKARIGGAFSLLDTDQFILSSNSDFIDFFPQKINNSNVIYFETGADSLAYIVKQICATNTDITEIYFPSHYCENTIHRLKIKVDGVKIVRYNSIDELVSNKPAILLWNHFNKYLEIKVELVPDNFILIEDFVHAPYDMKKSVSRHCFNSLRKVCNIDVSVCYSLNENLPLNTDITKYYFKRKEAELTKHYFQKLDFNEQLETKFLKNISESESLLESSTINLANKLEILKFKHARHSNIYKLRLDNYKAAIAKLSTKKTINFIDGEYMYLMIISSRRNELKKYLTQFNIYTTCHWIDSNNKEMAQSCISIYIDQRYDRDSLQFVIDKIIQFYDC